MRHRFGILVVLCLAAFPARAFETPPLTAPQRQAVVRIGTSFKMIANRFKCADFVWGDIAPDGRMVALKYIPVGDDFDKWTRMVTITVYALPSDPSAAPKAMEALIKNIEADTRKIGRVLKADSFTSAQKQPSLFVDYEMGDGRTREHDVGVFMRTAKDAAALIRVQARGLKMLEAGDAADIRSLPDIVVLPPQ